MRLRPAGDRLAEGYDYDSAGRAGASVHRLPLPAERQTHTWAGAAGLEPGAPGKGCPMDDDSQQPPEDEPTREPRGDHPAPPLGNPPQQNADVDVKTDGGQDDPAAK